MLPQCRDQGVGVVPWSPLARGVLARPREAYADKPTARAESDGFTPYLYDEGRARDRGPRR